MPAPKSKRSKYVRDRLDWYVEPAWAVELLFDRIGSIASVWDPACGQGTIPEVCRARGIRVLATDIAERGYRRQEGAVDFLSEIIPRPKMPIDAIITNPPYSLAAAFVERALGVAERLVAVIVRLDFLASQARHRLFSAHPPARVIVLSKRPSMPPGGTDIPPRGGQHDFCWLVWDADWCAPTRIEWAMPEVVG